MARFARINYPTGIYHIISRTLDRQYLISGAIERLYYLHLLGDAAKMTDASVLAWCLMSNHVHLVVRAGREPLSRLMKPVHSGFAVWLNRRLKRHGPVFADRYRSILVDEEDYLFQLVRYVHNNPVRAGVAVDPVDSAWTSHRAYLGLEPCPNWLKSGYVLGMFSENPENARNLFYNYVDEGKSEGRRPDLNGENLKRAGREIQSGCGDGWRLSGPIVGSDKFTAKVLQDISTIDEADSRAAMVDLSAMEQEPSLAELVGTVCAVLGLEPWEFERQPKQRTCALARRLITILWVQGYHKPQIEIARHLNTSTGAVSRWYSKAIQEIVETESLRALVVDNLPKKSDDCRTENDLKAESKIHYNLGIKSEF